MREHQGTACMKCGEPVPTSGGERWLLLYDADLDKFVDPTQDASPDCVYGRVCAGCLLGVPRRLRILDARMDR